MDAAGAEVRGDAEDRALVEAVVARRDEAAFRRLYGRHAGRLFALSRRFLGRAAGEADEVFQECWMRIVEGLPGFRWRSSFETWSAGIALNASREWRRRRQRDASPPREAAAPEATRGPSHERLDLEEALARLPQGYREVLLLHDVHGHTHEEIGALLGIVPGTSKSQLSRARRAARELLGTEDDDG